MRNAGLAMVLRFHYWVLFGVWMVGGGGGRERRRKAGACGTSPVLRENNNGKHVPHEYFSGALLMMTFFSCGMH